MNRISIDRKDIALVKLRSAVIHENFFCLNTDLLVIIKYTIPPERSGAHHMSVCQDVTFVGIYNETRRLTRHGRVGVKGARLTEMYRHHIFDYLLYCSLPFGRVRRRSDGRHQAVAIFRSRFGRVRAAQIAPRYIFAIQQVRKLRLQ